MNALILADYLIHKLQWWFITWALVCDNAIMLRQTGSLVTDDSKTIFHEVITSIGIWLGFGWSTKYKQFIIKKINLVNNYLRYLFKIAYPLWIFVPLFVCRSFAGIILPREINSMTRTMASSQRHEPYDCLQVSICSVFKLLLLPCLYG